MYDLKRKILQNAPHFQMEIDISNCQASSYENPSHKLLGYGFLQDQCYIMNLFFIPIDESNSKKKYEFWTTYMIIPYMDSTGKVNFELKHPSWHRCR